MSKDNATPAQRAARYQTEADEMLAEFRDSLPIDEMVEALAQQRREKARHLKRCKVCSNAVATVQCLQLVGIRLGLMAILFALASAESADSTKGEASSE